MQLRSDPSRTVSRALCVCGIGGGVKYSTGSVFFAGAVLIVHVGAAVRMVHRAAHLRAGVEPGSTVGRLLVMGVAGLPVSVLQRPA